MSFTKRSRSAIVKVPGVADGSVGFQFLALHRNELWSPWTRPTNTSDDDGRADRPEAQALMPDLGFLENVVPERRRGMQALLLGHRAVGGAVAVGGDLVRGERVLDLHVLGHVLARRQAEIDAALEVAEREIAAAARQVVQRRDQIGIELARSAMLTGVPPLSPSS